MHGGHHHHGHGHHHHHHHGPVDGLLDHRWTLAIGLNLAFVVVEAVAGVLAGSAALLADAAHNLSDVLSLVLAGGAAWLAKRPAHPRRTWGWGKATVLAALVNGVTLVFACGAIAWEAVRRFGEPVTPETGVVMIVAAVGVVINTATALLFLRGRKEDANVRGAFLHMAADAGVSAGVIVSAALIAFTGLAWIDPVTALVIVAVILAGTWGLLREAFDLAVDAVPAAIDVVALRAWLESRPGVTGVHDLHVWPTSTTAAALTAHLVAPDGVAPEFLRDTARTLKTRFGIAHATLQIEAAVPAECDELHA